VTFEQLREIALVHHQQFHFGIEGAELTDLSVLLGDQPLFEDGQFDEESLRPFVG